jgi:predicted secreted protein
MENEVKTRAGENFQVKLGGNATTGFRWEFVPAPENAGLVEFLNTSYEANKEQVGAPGLFRFQFRALAAGRTGLSFVYRRPWEQAEPRERTTIAVDID